MSLENTPENKKEFLLNNRYKVVSDLSAGGFGKTSLVEDVHLPSNRRFVLKHLQPLVAQDEAYQIVLKRFEREASILERLGEGHDQIPRLYAYFQEEEQFYLVQEWIQGLTLTEKVRQDGPQSESIVQLMLSHLLPVVDYVHGEQIFHRDIKPDNIILRASDGKPVLIDFGAVKEAMKTDLPGQRSIVVGTPGYMPYEQLSGMPVQASDIYSIGLTAIYLLTGKVPQELSRDQDTGLYNWRLHAPNISDKFANFLDCAIHQDPQVRFQTAEACLRGLHSVMMAHSNAQVPTYISGSQGRSQSSMRTRVVSPAQKTFVPNPLTAGQSAASARSSDTPSLEQDLKDNRHSKISRVNLLSIVLSMGVIGGFLASGIWYVTSQSKNYSHNPQKQTLTNEIEAFEEEPEGLDFGSDSKILTDETGSNELTEKNKTQEEKINDIADRIFFERHPELKGRSLDAADTELGAEWANIRACDAVVDFNYHKNNPEREGRPIAPGDTSEEQEWLSLKQQIPECD